MSPERSTTRGDLGSWTYLPPPVPTGEGSLFYPPMETSASDGDTVAIGGGALYVSRDQAGTWTRIAFANATTCSAMAIPSVDHVYVGTVDGQVLRTDWNGSSWSAPTALTSPNPAGGFISDLYVDAADPNRIWAVYRTFGGSTVWRSDDAGSTWTDRTAGLPGLPINAVEVDPRNGNRVWVAADLGVYQSLDGGATWAPFANGLPNVYVGDLVYHRHSRVLRAGTRNRGLWEIPVDGWMTAPVSGVQFTGTLGANQTQRWFTFNWPAPWHVIWTFMPTSPRPGAPQISWSVQVERASTEYATYWLTVTNLTPDPVTFEGRYSILSRY
jgi:hypothetical protein